MEIHASRKSKTADKLPDELIQKYPHDVTMYKLLPDDEITMDDLEDLLKDRVHLLMNIKATHDKGFTAHSKEWKNHLHELLTRDNLYDYQRLLFNPDHKITPEDIRRRRKDYLSFCMMAIGYCNSSDKRSWLLSLELDVFRLKFLNLNESSVREFLKINAAEFPYECLTNEEKNAMKDALVNASIKPLARHMDTTDFYKVPFLDAPHLLSEYMWIKKGIIYVPHTEIYSLAENIFRKNLNQRLATFSKRYDTVMKGHKLEPIFSCLSTSSCDESEYIVGKKIVTLSSLSQLSKTSFPLCTQNLYDALLQFNHLKYNGRQVLQLYLKGIGLPIEGCVELFRKIFMKTIDEAQFKKEYLYSIRHNYGLEGSKINYSPPSCLNIMKLPISAGDHHGCPFKIWDHDKIKSKLEENKLSSQGVHQIMEYVKGGHPQVACSKYFEHKHNGTTAGINHPNQYFEESQKYYESLSENKDSVPSTSKEPMKREGVVKKQESSVASTSKSYMLDNEPVSEELMDIDAAVFDSDM